MKNYAITSISNTRSEYPDHTNQEFLTLQEYLDIARYTIVRSVYDKDVRRNMLSSEDAITHVAHAMMIGDWRFDTAADVRSMGYSRRGYRGRCARWGILDYIDATQNKKNKKLYSLNFNFGHEEDNKEVGALVEDYRDKETDEEGNYCLEKREEMLMMQEFIDKIFESDILSDRETECIRMYYLEEKTMEEVAKEIGITRQGVSYNIERGIKRIKKILNE